MARRKLRRSTLFTVIALIGLLSLGVGYAMWTQTLTINSTVDTAEFDVHWDAAPLAAVTADPLSSVFDCSAVITGDELTIGLTDAYPGAQCTVTAAVDNDSSIPVNALADISFTVPGELELDSTGCDIDDGDQILAGGTEPCVLVIGVDPDPNNSLPGMQYVLTGTVTYGVN